MPGDCAAACTQARHRNSSAGGLPGSRRCTGPVTKCPQAQGARNVSNRSGTRCQADSSTEVIHVQPREVIGNPRLRGTSRTASRLPTRDRPANSGSTSAVSVARASIRPWPLRSRGGPRAVPEARIAAIADHPLGRFSLLWPESHVVEVIHAVAAVSLVAVIFFEARGPQQRCCRARSR